MLTDAEIEEFTRDGCIAVRGVLDRRVADRITDDDNRGPFVQLIQPPLATGFVSALDELFGAGTWKIGQLSFQVRRPAAAVRYSAHYPVAEREGASSAPQIRSFHRDAMGPKCLGILFVLAQAVTVENGATQLLIGSQHDGPVPDLSREVRFATGDPGDVWIAHRDLYHSTSRNTTARPRSIGVVVIDAVAS